MPLESRVDFLTLKTGQKFELPFATLLVFATNLRPSTLVDEAFLRRIHYKVFAESSAWKTSPRSSRKCCVERSLVSDRELVDRLVRDFYEPRRVPLRGRHPRDLIEQAISLADYQGEPRKLTPSLLKAACDSYFVEDEEPSPPYSA